MSKYRIPLPAALLGAAALFLAGPALAHHDGYGPPGNAWGYYGHHHHHRERGMAYYGPGPVVVAPPPAVLVPRPVYYPAPYYYPPRPAPAVVIGVDIPPLVIPLR